MTSLSISSFCSLYPFHKNYAELLVEKGGHIFARVTVLEIYSNINKPYI